VKYTGVKYRDLREILEAHGYREVLLGEEGIDFRAEGRGYPVIRLPRYRKTQDVHPAHVFVTRQTLSATGLVDEDQFDEEIIQQRFKARDRRSRARRAGTVTSRRGGGGNGAAKSLTTLAAAPER
jgi:hypothetical protein